MMVMVMNNDHYIMMIICICIFFFVCVCVCDLITEDHNDDFFLLLLVCFGCYAILYVFFYRAKIFGMYFCFLFPFVYNNKWHLLMNLKIYKKTIIIQCPVALLKCFLSMVICVYVYVRVCVCVLVNSWWILYKQRI